MNYSPLNHHIADLSKTFIRMNDWIGYDDVSDWLRIAAGIKSVDFDDTDYNDLLGYCGDADNYDSAREHLLQKHVTNLSVFTYVWGALECFIEHIYPDKSPERKEFGKVGAACFYITNFFSPELTPIGYDTELSKLKNIVDNHSEFSEIAKRFLNLPNHINHQSTGLHAIYKLRNLFVHGKLTFPFPDSNTDDLKSNFDLHIIEISTRIVLLSLQMLLSAKERENNYKITADWIGYDVFDCDDANDEPEVDLLRLLKVIHLSDLDLYWAKESGN